MSETTPTTLPSTVTAGDGQQAGGGCCDTARLGSCCEPTAKSACCGAPAQELTTAPSTCGCN